jgi:hypothetical protein
VLETGVVIGATVFVTGVVIGAIVLVIGTRGVGSG